MDLKMLPNVNNQQASEVAPGVNPNQRTKTPDKSLLNQYSTNIASTIGDSISPMNMIRQGTYGAFGNNALTRTGMGMLDSTTDAISKFLGIGDEETETSTDKLIKEQIKLQVKTNQLLDDLIKAQNTKLEPTPAEDGKQSRHRVEKIEDSPELHPHDFTNSLIPKGDLHKVESSGSNIIETIARNVVDIKEILTHGFESIEQIFEHDGQKFKRKKNKLDGIEDAKIVKFTENKKDGTGKGKTLLQKYQVESIKLLKRIAIGVDKIYALASSSNDLSAPEKEDESSRRNKHMGMVDEVSDAKIVGEATPQLTDESGGSGLTGAAAALVTTILTSMKSARELVADALKAGYEEFKSGITKLWEAGKDIASKAVNFLKEKGRSMLESVENAASNASEKLFGKEGAKALVKKTAGNLAKAIPFVGEAVMVGLAGKDAYDSYNDATDVLDIKDREATTGEKVEAGIGGAVESLSFGLLDKKKTAKWIDGLMTSKDEKQSELTQKQTELNDAMQQRVSPAAPAAGSPSVAVNTTNNSYFSARKNARNDDSSYNRYLDKHYAF